MHDEKEVCWFMRGRGGGRLGDGVEHPRVEEEHILEGVGGGQQRGVPGVGLEKRVLGRGWATLAVVGGVEPLGRRDRLRAVLRDLRWLRCEFGGWCGWYKADMTGTGGCACSCTGTMPPVLCAQATDMDLAAAATSRVVTLSA